MSEQKSSPWWWDTSWERSWEHAPWWGRVLTLTLWALVCSGAISWWFGVDYSNAFGIVFALALSVAWITKQIKFRHVVATSMAIVAVGALYALVFGPSTPQASPKVADQHPVMVEARSRADDVSNECWNWSMDMDDIRFRIKRLNNPAAVLDEARLSRSERQIELAHCLKQKGWWISPDGVSMTTDGLVDQDSKRIWIEKPSFRFVQDGVRVSPKKEDPNSVGEYERVMKECYGIVASDPNMRQMRMTLKSGVLRDTDQEAWESKVKLLELVGWNGCVAKQVAREKDRVLHEYLGLEAERQFRGQQRLDFNTFILMRTSFSETAKADQETAEVDQETRPIPPGMECPEGTVPRWNPTETAVECDRQ
jgi:hypothetical protein